MDYLRRHDSLWHREGRVRRPLGVWLGRVGLGPWGEWITLRHLRRLGWDVVARNWRHGRGEVDLIAYHDATLVFLEVKTRLLPALRPPEHNLTQAKARRLERLIQAFLERYEPESDGVRLDLVAVETADWRHYTLRHWMGV